MNLENATFVRNQLYYGDFGLDTIGSEQNGLRPFVVIQNNLGNRFSPNLIVAPITSVQKVKDCSIRKINPTHVLLLQKDYPALKSDSVILTEQIRTISKKRVRESVSTYNVALQPAYIQKLNEVLELSVGVAKDTPQKMSNVSRGDVYFADLGRGVGFESCGVQPVLVIQNDLGNHFSPTTIVVSIVFNQQSKVLPTHVKIKKGNGTTNFCKPGNIQTEQIRTIDKTRLIAKVGTVSNEILAAVDQALQVSIGLNNSKEN